MIWVANLRHHPFHFHFYIYLFVMVSLHEVVLQEQNQMIADVGA
jgi:hypothetical protein